MVVRVAVVLSLGLAACSTPTGTIDENVATTDAGGHVHHHGGDAIVDGDAFVSDPDDPSYDASSCPCDTDVPAPPPPKVDGGTPGDAPIGPTGLAPELGTGDHSATSVTFTTIASTGLKTPRDLDFNPRKPDELWIVSYGDESMTIVSQADKTTRTSERRKDSMADHFMARATAIAFGADATTFGTPGTFATCGESRNTYDGTAPANDFMGPTLWSSDLSIFAVVDPHGLGSHIDMLHVAPLCMGIAHERDNVYWTFAGVAQSIIEFDFHRDHGIGNDDHTDGEAWEFAHGQLGYATGVPSGLEFRAADGMLYVSDTGHARVAKLDTRAGTVGADLPTEDGSTFHRMDGTTLVDVVPASSGLLTRPSGLAIKGDYLYVADDATSRLSAFTFAGALVNWLDTGLPKSSLGGLAFGPDGKLYFADRIGNRVLRIDAR